ncbi:MAG: TerD family protein [Planctomycetaceae bacterium]|nr:TerD family protein [Planctomycetaceae bacterium]
MYRMSVEVQWDGDNVDMDLSCFLVNRAGECDWDNFVFYNSPRRIPALRKNGASGQVVESQENIDVCYPSSKNQAVVYYGNALFGEGVDGEKIFVDLARLPRAGSEEDIVKIRFVLTIYKKHDEPQKTFADVSGITITIWDETGLDRVMINQIFIPTTADEYQDKYSMDIGAIIFDEAFWQWRYESYEKAEKRTLPEYAKEYGISEERP